MIICYGLIALEAILIIILFLKIHGVNSDMKRLMSMTAIAKGALAQNEALLMQLKDKAEKEKGCGV